MSMYHVHVFMFQTAVQPSCTAIAYSRAHDSCILYVALCIDAMERCCHTYSSHTYSTARLYHGGMYASDTSCDYHAIVRRASDRMAWRGIIVHPIHDPISYSAAVVCRV